MIPSSCTLSVRFSFTLHPINSQFLLLTFVVWITQLLTPCHWHFCSLKPSPPLPAALTKPDFANILPFATPDNGIHSLPQRFSFVILPLGLLIKSVFPPSSCIWLGFASPTLKTALWTPLLMLPSFTYFYGASSAPRSPSSSHYHVSHASIERSPCHRPSDYFARQTYAMVSLHSGLLCLFAFKRAHLTLFYSLQQSGPLVFLRH